MRVKPFKYRGMRGRRQTVVEFQQLPGERWFPLPLRLDLAKHSPTGFEFGYLGSGPAQLALALLATRLDRVDALHLYQYFKEVVVAFLGPSWTLEGEEVDQIIAQLRDRYPLPPCRVCGCTEERACEGGCYWVEPGLCSQCGPQEGVVPLEQATSESMGLN